MSRLIRSPSISEVEVPFSARFHLGRSGRHPDGELIEGLRMSRRVPHARPCPVVPDTVLAGPPGAPPDACAARVNVRASLLGAGSWNHGPDIDAGGKVVRTPGSSGAWGPLPHARPCPVVPDTVDVDFAHLPVMVDEVVELMGPVPAGVVLDATVGGGGHARAILEAHPHLQVIGMDQDPDAVEAAGRVLQPCGSRARVVRGRFDHLDQVLDDAGVDRLSGALFDLGVSSVQLDRAERGFSYRADAPLDMRMDPEQARTAADVVNQASERDLIQLLSANGEGRFAGRIARAIIAARPVSTTGQLADVVRSAIPAAVRRTGGHPARRAFQAIRIAVNEELAVLPVALDATMDRLAPRGRCVVLAYHSGEDRVVKDRFRTAATGGCICPPGLPCVCGATPTVRLLTRGARKPTAAEVAANRRSESARLRAVERLDEGEETTRQERPQGPDGSHGRAGRERPQGPDGSHGRAGQERPQGPDGSHGRAWGRGPHAPEEPGVGAPGGKTNTEGYERI